MIVTLWGTRGSLATAGPDTVRYGGDTACVQVEGPDGEVIILDAGSGVRPVGEVVAGADRIDVLLTHLHMDHIQGLGFFGPIFDPAVETHIWGPPSATLSLGERLSRYLSPPLFPVHLRDLPNTVLHDVDRGGFSVGSVTVGAEVICHPGTTLGFRLEANGSSVAYLPDHEPALGVTHFPDVPEWTSGHALMVEADLLIHDAQYTEAEYATRMGWGHSTLEHVTALAERAGVGALVTFHHDPSHSDDMLDAMNLEVASQSLSFEFVPGRTGDVFRLD